MKREHILKLRIAWWFTRDPLPHRGHQHRDEKFVFNVPARRNFLKSNAAEMRHIVDEFIRVALSFPEIFFSLTNNQQEIFHLEKGSLKQRIVQILGANYNARLVAVNEQTDYLNIRGFVGKPETAKKTRGDQYFFVNNRFIRSAYLNHAVMSAFQDMISGDSFPCMCCSLILILRSWISMFIPPNRKSNLKTKRLFMPLCSPQ